jgi:hypothetical protein
LSVGATGHPVWNRARATAAGHASKARAPPATRSMPCSALHCPHALAVLIHCRPWAVIEANPFSPPREALMPASAPLLPLCFYATLRSCRRQASVNGRRGAGTFPKPSIVVKSCLKQAEAVHHPPLWRHAVDSTPLIPSRSTTTSPSWALGLCYSPTRKPSSLTTCTAQHRRLTPAQVHHHGG